MSYRSSPAFESRPFIAAQPTPPHRGDDQTRFKVSGTAYMRNLSRQDLNTDDWVAVTYQRPPRRTENGTSFGLRFPVIIIPHMIEDAKAMAEQMAEILNRHWPEGEVE